MAEKALYRWKCLEIVENGWKWLEMAIHFMKDSTWMDIAGQWLEFTGKFGNGWKCLDIA